MAPIFLQSSELTSSTKNSNIWKKKQKYCFWNRKFIRDQFYANFSFVNSNISRRMLKSFYKLLQTKQNLFDIEKYMKALSVGEKRFKLKFNSISGVKLQLQGKKVSIFSLD